MGLHNLVRVAFAAAAIAVSAAGIGQHADAGTISGEILSQHVLSGSGIDVAPERTYLEDCWIRQYDENWNVIWQRSCPTDVIGVARGVDYTGHYTLFVSECSIYTIWPDGEWSLGMGTPVSWSTGLGCNNHYFYMGADNGTRLAVLTKVGELVNYIDMSFMECVYGLDVNDDMAVMCNGDRCLWIGYFNASRTGFDRVERIPVYRIDIVGAAFNSDGTISANDGDCLGVTLRGFLPIPGDVDRDGHVDVTDLLFLVDAFGYVTGDVNYDAGCDFNKDDAVDVVDLLIMVENFGR
jgi:hypothetical protein